MLKLPRKFEVSWSICLIVCWSSNIWGFDWTGLWCGWKEQALPVTIRVSQFGWSSKNWSSQTKPMVLSEAASFRENTNQGPRDWPLVFLLSAGYMGLSNTFGSSTEIYGPSSGQRWNLAHLKTALYHLISSYIAKNPFWILNHLSQQIS